MIIYPLSTHLNAVIKSPQRSFY